MNYICSDENGESPIEGFNVMKIRVNRTAKVISAPIESGQESFDNKVIQPLEVVVTGNILVSDETGAESTIAEMFASRAFKFYAIREEDRIYQKMVLKACPYDRETSTPDFKVYELTFVEAMLIQDNKYTPANPEDRDTVKSGRVQPNPVSTSSSSVENPKNLKFLQNIHL